jgi:hypothetical protein
MFPTPAMKLWSSSSTLSLAERFRSRSANRRALKARANGSGPCPLNTSPMR